MPIIGSRVTYLTVIGQQAGELCYTTLPYFCTDYTPTARGRDVALEFLDSVIPAWAALVSEHFTFSSIRYREAGPGALPPGDVNISGSAGLVTGGSLPVYNTFALTKVPDNLAVEPVGAPDFDFGRVSISGVPESSQDNGGVTGLVADALDTLGETMRVLTIGAETFQMFMIRPGVPGGAPTAVAPVDAILFNKLGTQNTRKR